MVADVEAPAWEHKDLSQNQRFNLRALHGIQPEVDYKEASTRVGIPIRADITDRYNTPRQYTSPELEAHYGKKQQGIGYIEHFIETTRGNPVLFEAVLAVAKVRGFTWETLKQDEFDTILEQILQGACG